MCTFMATTNKRHATHIAQISEIALSCLPGTEIVSVLSRNLWPPSFLSAAQPCNSSIALPTFLEHSSAVPHISSHHFPTIMEYISRASTRSFSAEAEATKKCAFRTLSPEAESQKPKARNFTANFTHNAELITVALALNPTPCQRIYYYW